MYPAFTLPAWLADLTLVAVPVILAALVIVLWRRRRASTRQNWMVLDGSNIMHWKGGTPDLAPVREAIAVLDTHGYKSCVVFDANAGYLLFGRYGRESNFAKRLDLPEKHIMVVPKGTPADPYILAAARDVGAGVVTNDQYRDWVGDFPEIRTRSHLVSGGYRGRKLTLNLPRAANAWPRTPSRRAS